MVDTSQSDAEEVVSDAAMTEADFSGTENDPELESWVVLKRISEASYTKSGKKDILPRRLGI